MAKDGKPNILQAEVISGGLPLDDLLGSDREMQEEYGVWEEMSSGLAAVRPPTPLNCAPATREELVEAAQSGKGGCLSPWNVEKHRDHCPICRLSEEEQQAIEAAYLSWERPSAIASGYTFSPQAVRYHAQVFMWDIRRLSSLGAAYGRLVEAGLESALNGAATPETAFLALDRLRSLVHGRRDPLAENREGLELSYEERIRRVRRVSSKSSKASQ